MKLDNDTKNRIKRSIFEVHLRSNAEDKYWKWYTTQLCNELDKQFPGKEILSCEEIRGHMPPSILITGVCVIEVKNDQRKTFDVDSKPLISVNVVERILPGILVNFAHGRNPGVYWYYLDHQNRAVKENAEEEILLNSPEVQKQDAGNKNILPKVAIGVAAAAAGISALALGIRASRNRRRNK